MWFCWQPLSLLHSALLNKDVCFESGIVSVTSWSTTNGEHDKTEIVFSNLLLQKYVVSTLTCPTVKVLDRTHDFGVTHTFYLGGSRGLVVKVLDSKFEGCEFKTHTEHGFVFEA